MFGDDWFGRNIKEKYNVSIDNLEVETAGRPTWHRREVKGLVRNFVVYKTIKRILFISFSICLFLELLLGIS